MVYPGSNQAVLHPSVFKCNSSAPLPLTRWSLKTAPAPYQEGTPPPTPTSPPPWPQAPTAAQPTPHPPPGPGSLCTQAPPPSSCLSPWPRLSCCSAPVEAHPAPKPPPILAVSRPSILCFNLLLTGDHQTDMEGATELFRFYFNNNYNNKNK